MPEQLGKDMTSSDASLEDRRIGFLGCGAMARALAGGLLAGGMPKDHLRGTDLAAEARERFESELGIQTLGSNAELVRDCDVVVVCVKPGAVESLLAGLADSPDRDRPLWISIAAGIPIASYEKLLPTSARIIRTMPNTPALVGAGATAICPNAAANSDDRGIAEALFRCVGRTWMMEQEEQLDAVTGLSGSGPAYVFLILEALEDAGVRQGLPRDAAGQLAIQTVYGAAKLALESDLHPRDLRQQVTSPGGTTIAGLQRLEAGGVRAAILAAVTAATQRSRDLSR